METFKLDLSTLTPVAEADRVKGSWYVVADNLMTDTPAILRFHSDSHNMNAHGEKSVNWYHWFAIPPNLPGFPQAELPDEFELDYNDWQVEKPQFRSPKMTIKIKRKPITLPQLSIPSGTKSEQVAELKRLLEELS